MSGAVEQAPADPPRHGRRAWDTTLGIVCLFVWMVAMMLLAAVAGALPGAALPAAGGMLGLFALAWGLAEYLVRAHGHYWAPAVLGLVGPICLGFGVALVNRETGVLPSEQWLGIICGTAALGMLLFLFRMWLAVLVSPIITFSLVALFLGVRGVSKESLGAIEGFSPRGILAALVDEPLHMAVFGTLAVAAIVYARWLDLYGQAFGMRSAKPLHIIGAGVTALIASRLAVALPTPLDLAVLAGLFAAFMGWGLRVDRLAVMATSWFAMARPLILTVLDLTGTGMDIRDFTVAHMAVLGVGFLVWPVVRRWTVAAGYTKKPRYITWNWPDRVIWPYRPPPGHR